MKAKSMAKHIKQKIGWWFLLPVEEKGTSILILVQRTKIVPNE